MTSFHQSSSNNRVNEQTIMAIDTFPQDSAVRQSEASSGGELSSLDYVKAVLTPLASLRLTVFLLFLAVFVTFVATLEQTRSDVYNVKMRHFESLFVSTPFTTFLPPAWFPDLQNVPGGIYLPSGLSILIMMLINLTAAHLLRFKLKARGSQLLIGIAVAAFASFMTWAIIFNGPNVNGFQSEPPISFKSMWVILQIAVFGIGLSTAIGFVSMAKERKVERTLLALGTISCIGCLVLTLVLGERAFIGDSAMRILWQLAQATIAGIIAFLACKLLFNRKAGIVLIHLGVAGLMANEIYVYMTNVEQRMTLFEGQTLSTAIDIRHTEMAIIDVSDPEFDNIVTVPGEILVANSNAQKPGSENVLIQDDGLPFNVRCLRYMANSDIRDLTSGESLATEGLGKRMEAIALPVVAGTDSEQVADFASAYVELTTKDKNLPLGVFLISQNLDENKADSVWVDRKEYHISLRFKTDYKPYSLTLIDAQQENYIGTETPRWYSSDVVLNDFENDIQSDQKIWMNNPLRYSGETFYQTGMDTLDSGKTYSVIQVVRNHGWMIPYVCCMFTVIGLIAQFGVSLLGFLEKERKAVAKGLTSAASLAVGATTGISPGTVEKGITKATEAAASAMRSRPTEDELAKNKSKWTKLPAILIVGFFGLWAAGEAYKAYSPKVEANEINLELLGQVPVTINGRVQPIDSVARNTARQLSKREELVDGGGEKQPAIRWFADTLFEAEGYQDYFLFRIEDTNVVSSLNLPSVRASDSNADKRFRFTLSEIFEAESKLRKLIPNAKDKDPKTWTQLEKRLNSVAGMIQKVYGFKLALGRPPMPEDEDILTRLESAGQALSSPLIPLVIPTANEDAPWVSMMSLQDRAWLSGLADEYGKDSTDALSRAIIEKNVLPQLREETIRSRIVQRFLSDPDFLKVMEEQHQETDPEVLGRTMLDNWDDLPANIKDPLVAAESPMVDAMIAQQMPRYESVLEEQIAVVNGGKGELDRTDLKLVSMLNQLKPAYLADDADAFNTTLSNYLQQVKEVAPAGLTDRKIATERYYNAFSPFYIASVFYLITLFIAPLGWLFARSSVSWNLACKWLLIVGLGIHIIGLILRVIISGRPPVTNLYSSVLFVSAAFVVICLVVEKITKLGIGNFVAGLGGFGALLWAWTMTIASGDTFTVMVAVLDTQFWLSTHVVCISIGYAATFGAGLLGAKFILASLVSKKFQDKTDRRLFANVIYGVVCFGLLCSFFGTVLGGLWGDDSWGRFWGWDPKENGALMIVLWNALVLHARWGGIVKERGLAALAVLGNVVVLWSWKGVNELGVGLHAYAGNEDNITQYILWTGAGHAAVAALVLILPGMLWRSYQNDGGKTGLV
jgi:ABC-type transport system involved in cytochrome c biogenesis permease subunit